jgi:hypothetical protein
LQLEVVRDSLAKIFSIREALEAILNLKPDVQRQVITLLYLWRTERCGVREGEQQRNCCNLARLIHTYAEEWSSVKTTKKVGSTSQPRQFWKPPLEEFVKCNCDGAFNLTSRSGGWGFLLRGYDGGVISSSYGKLENVGEAFHAETIACEHLQQLPKSTWYSCKLGKNTKNHLQQLGKSTPYLSQLGIFSSRARCRLRIARFGVDRSLPRDDFLCIFLHALACVRTKASSPQIWREQDTRAACVRTKAWLGAGSEGGVRGGLGEVVAGELEEQRRREPMMQTKVMPPEGKEDGLDRYFICVGPTSEPTFFIFTKLE